MNNVLFIIYSCALLFYNYFSQEHFVLTSKFDQFSVKGLCAM